jgi:hypothetical protein
VERLKPLGLDQRDLTSRSFLTNFGSTNAVIVVHRKPSGSRVGMFNPTDKLTDTLRML